MRFFSLQTNKSPVHNGISFNIIKSCLRSLSTPLLNFFNFSLEKGIFPDELKIAKVNAIFKNGDENDFGNYRPISVLPCFSKMLERVLHKKRLCNHLLQNHILIFYIKSVIQQNISQCILLIKLIPAFKKFILH